MENVELEALEIVKKTGSELLAIGAILIPIDVPSGCAAKWSKQQTINRLKMSARFDFIGINSTFLVLHNILNPTGLLLNSICIS